MYQNIEATSAAPGSFEANSQLRREIDWLPTSKASFIADSESEFSDSAFQRYCVYAIPTAALRKKFTIKENALPILMTVSSLT